MESLHSEKRNGFDINVTYDDYPDSPDEWGNYSVRNWREVDGLEKTDTGADISPELQAKLDDGRAFFVDKYEHGNVRYALMGETGGDMWDTSRGWGIIEFTPEYIEGTTKAERETYARQDLTEYTQWANGEVYSIHIEEDGEWIDGNGGIYGTLEDVIQQARDTVDRLTPARDATRAPRATSLHI